jgi:SAM-dependent methyltransferase
MLSNKEITKQSYQATAQAFAENVADLAPKESIETMMSLLPKHPRILDIGCGSGRDAKLFSNLGAEVVGIDFCPEFIQIAKANAPTAEFKLMDIETMDFPSGQFDAAWAACSLMHIEKRVLPDVLKKIHQLLKDNGYFYLAVKQGTGEKLEADTRYEGDYQKFWSYFEEAELKQALTTAKFKIQVFELVEKSHQYQTHAAFKIFCQK